MKPLEEIFFKACVHEQMRVNKSSEREFTVRNIVNIFSRLGFPHKQLWYYLEKWSNCDVYDYGVTMDLGWFNIDKFTGDYLKLYEEIKASKGITNWEDGEFTEYIIANSTTREAVKEAIKTHCTDLFPLVAPKDETSDAFIAKLKLLALEGCGVPREFIFSDEEYAKLKEELENGEKKV